MRLFLLAPRMRPNFFTQNTGQIWPVYQQTRQQEGHDNYNGRWIYEKLIHFSWFLVERPSFE
jgi:hypothetical protein